MNQMQTLLRRPASLWGAALMCCVAANAQAESTWERLKRSGELNVGCVQNQVYHHKNKQGEWEGMIVEASKQLAKDLEPVGVKKWQCVETDWGSSVLALQSGKIDVMFNLQATPLRATTVTFAGPMFDQGIMMVNRKGFSAQGWGDYDKPDVKVAVVLGESSDLVRKLLMPSAQPVALPRQNDLALAVIANRADALITWAIAGSVMKLSNPDLGELVIPEPAYTFPQYAAIARDEDRIFADYMHWWVEWQRKNGKFEDWLRNQLVNLGLPTDAVPKRLLN